MANFSFLINRFLTSSDVVSANSENISITKEKIFVKQSVEGSVELSLLDAGLQVSKDTYRVRVQKSGTVDGGAKAILHRDLAEANYYDSTNWWGVNKFFVSRADKWIYPDTIVKPRTASLGTELYSVAINNTDGTTLECYILNQDTSSFTKRGTINDPVNDGGIDRAALFVIDKSLYVAMTKIDAAGDGILKISSNDGTNWQTLSTFELCSFSDTIEAITAAHANGRIMVMGSYEASASFHIISYAYSETLGYSWEKTSQLFHIDMTAATNSGAQELKNPNLGIALVRDHLEDQFILAERNLIWEESTSTFHNRLYFYKTKNCEDFEYINHFTTKGAWNNDTEDATSIFEPTLVVGMGDDARRIYGFSSFGRMDNWRDFNYGIRMDSCQQNLGLDSTTQYTMRGMNGLIKLNDFVKFKDHYLLTCESANDGDTGLNVLHLGDWSTISERVEYDCCYAALDKKPEDCEWEERSGGSNFSSTLLNGELELACNNDTSWICYVQRPVVVNNQVWNGISFSERSDGDVLRRANWVDGFTIKATLKIPFIDLSTYDNTATAIGFSVNALTETGSSLVRTFGIFFSTDAIFMKEVYNSAAATTYYPKDLTVFHDVLISGGGNDGVHVKGWIKKSTDRDWILFADVTTSLYETERGTWGELVWGSNFKSYTIEAPFKVDNTSIWKEFKFYSQNEGGLLTDTTNPDDLEGHGVTAIASYLYNDVQVIYGQGDVVVGDNWVLEENVSSVLEAQGSKGNIFSDRRSLEWRSKTDTTDDYLIFHNDNGFTRFDTLILLGVNFHYCHIQGQNLNATNWDTSGTINFDTTIDFRKDGDPSNTIYNNILIKTDTTDLRYFRISIPQQDTTQGYYKIGSVGIGQLLTLTDNPEYPIKETERYKSYKVSIKTGEDRYLTKEGRIRMWNVQFKALQYTEYKEVTNLVEETEFGYRSIFFAMDYDASSYDPTLVRLKSDLASNKIVGDLRGLKMQIEEAL